jgi:6-phosphogluconolactonase
LARTTYSLALLVALAPALIASCSGSEKSDEPGTSGGQSPSTGGAPSNGGTPSGGGGIKATGGASTGGAKASGGSSTGGTNNGGSTGGGGALTGGNPSASGSGGGGTTGGSATAGGTGGTGGSGGSPTGGMGGAGSPGKTYVYVSGSSQISIFALDAAAGTLTSAGKASAGMNANYLAVSKDKKFLYQLNEQTPSRVIAFTIDPSNGSLTEINRGDTTGEGAPHIAVHPSGKWLVVPHYNSGHINVFAVRDDGGVGAITTTSRGPNDGCQKAHQAVFDESGDHLFVPCLGSNYVIQFNFNAGMLAFNDPPTVAVMGGPRHFALSPTAPFAYALSELNSTITQLSYDKASGKLSNPTSIPSVENTSGASAHIAIHSSGKFLYASNRTENSIGAFSLDATSGKATPIAFEKSMISTPRDFGLDPSGQFLISANQDGQQDLNVYRIDQTEGRLMKLPSVPVGGRPASVGFVVLP